MSIPITEGWMAEKPLHVKVYHYIRETRSLCLRYGLYTSDLMADQGQATRGREDCAECFLRLRKLRPVPAPSVEEKPKESTCPHGYPLPVRCSRCGE